MFYQIAKQALFTLDPELAHETTLKSLRRLENYKLLSPFFPAEEGKKITCMGLEFPNPVGLAAGLDKEGNTIDAFGRMGFGFIEVGTLTPKPQDGNPKPRMFRLPEHQALINRMGFNNPGIKEGVENVKKSETYKGVVGINIGKNKGTPNEQALDDYLRCLREAYSAADYITVNLSSPNTPGLRDLQNEEETRKLLVALRDEQQKLSRDYGKHVPIALKVAPDLAEDHISALAQVFNTEGLECLIATNTTIRREAVEGHSYEAEAGGLSGAPATDLSTKVIQQFRAELSREIPVIGVGGIMCGDHAREKMEAGASLVQLYTGFVYEGPPLVRECIRAMSR